MGSLPALVRPSKVHSPRSESADHEKLAQQPGSADDQQSERAEHGPLRQPCRKLGHGDLRAQPLQPCLEAFELALYTRELAFHGHDILHFISALQQLAQSIAGGTQRIRRASVSIIWSVTSDAVTVRDCTSPSVATESMKASSRAAGTRTT